MLNLRAIEISLFCGAIRNSSNGYICVINNVHSLLFRFNFEIKVYFISSGHKVDPCFQKKLAAMFASLYEASQPNQPRGTNACTAGGPLDATVCCWWRTQCSKKEIERQKNSYQLKTLFVNQLIY